MTKEEWKPILGYEGYYEISNFGNVRSLDIVENINGGKRKRKGKLRKLSIKDNGYYFLILYKNNVSKNLYIHRLVMENFSKEIPDGYEVNHIDGNKANNHISNLEIVTHQENIVHSYENNLSKRAEKHSQSKLSNEDVFFIRKNYKPFDTEFGAKPLSEKYGVGKSTISTIANYKKRLSG